MSINNKKESTSISHRLDESYLSLVRDWSLWEKSLEVSLEKITRTVSKALRVSRVGLWLLNQDSRKLTLEIMYIASNHSYSKGLQINIEDCPDYFLALDENRVIAAFDALTDKRTSELSKDYLTPLGIGSILDATMRIAGNFRGVLCNEHIGPARIWNDEEKQFAISVADLMAQLITYHETRKSEAHLAELAASQQAILDGADYSIISTDTSGIIVSFNKAAQRMLGYQQEEMIGKQTPEIIHDQAEVRKRAEELSAELGEKINPGFEVFVALPKRGQAEEREWTYIDKSGRRFPVRLSVTPILGRNEIITGYMGIAADLSEQKMTLEELRRSESNYRLLFENMTSGFALHEIICDEHGEPADYRYLEANPAFEKLTGVPVANIVGKRLREILPNTEDYWIKIFGKVALTGEPISYENYSREIGKYFDTWVFSPKKNQFAVIFTDISSRKIAEAQMQKLSGAIEQTADSVIITDRNGVIEYVNPAFEISTGFTADEALGQTPCILKSDKHDVEFYRHLWSTILSGSIYNEVIINRRKDGSLFYEEKTISPLKDEDGNVTHFISTGKDVTERMKVQEKLVYMAEHDTLTTLPNRSLLLYRIQLSIANSRRHNRMAALLFIDIDRFKTINDTLGHETGDQMLQQLGMRLSGNVREGDTVARFGGDEFVILLNDVGNEHDIGSLAQKILDSFKQPFRIQNQSLHISVSIGIAIFPNDGEDGTTLLKHADIAMYRAKEVGKNTYQFYSSEMSTRAFERLTLESNMRRALEQQEFVLHYQPQVDTNSGKILGVEALLRWQHPDFGLVYPSNFISLLEETGLIVPIGEWVMDEASRQFSEWYKDGYRDLRLAVNLSPRQIHSSTLLDTVRRVLDKIPKKSNWLELEITEGLLVEQSQVLLKTFDELRAMNVRLAIDDFGTGYSSLSYLRRLQVDTIKIDRSFVQDVPDDADDSAIASTIIAMAHNLHLDVIAEGVENIKQRDFLIAQGCQQMQGFLYTKPIPAAELACLLENNGVLQKH